MDLDQLDYATQNALADAAKKGARLFAVGPVTPGLTTPTGEARRTLPGVQAQIAHQGQLLPGYGATADDAIMNAIGKM